MVPALTSSSRSTARRPRSDFPGHVVDEAEVPIEKLRPRADGSPFAR